MFEGVLAFAQLFLYCADPTLIVASRVCFRFGFILCTVWAYLFDAVSPCLSGSCVISRLLGEQVKERVVILSLRALVNPFSQPDGGSCFSLGQKQP